MSDGMGTWLAITVYSAGVSEGIVLYATRVFGDAVISLCAVLALLLMLVSIDPRVRVSGGERVGRVHAPVTSVSNQTCARYRRWCCQLLAIAASTTRPS